MEDIPIMLKPLNAHSWALLNQGGLRPERQYGTQGRAYYGIYEVRGAEFKLSSFTDWCVTSSKFMYFLEPQLFPLELLIT